MLCRMHDACFGMGSVESPRQTRKPLARCQRPLILARIDRLTELTPSRVVAALAEFKANGITGAKAKSRNNARTASTRTLESRVVAIKAFSRWAWRDGRTAD